MTKPKIDPATLVRQMPKTMSAMIVGSCGHNFKERFYLNFDARGDRTPEKIVIAEAHHREVQETGSNSPCPTCVATEAILDTRKRFNKLTTLLDIDPFRELDDTAPRASYAETIREPIVYNEVSRIVDHVWERLLHTSVMDKVLSESLSRAWKINPIDQPSKEMQKLLDNLAELYPVAFGSETRIMTTEMALATWLLLKYELPLVGIFYETRSKVWITANRTVKGLPLLRLEEIPSQVYLAAIIVAQMSCWETPKDAWIAFSTLIGYATHEVSSFLNQQMDEAPTLEDTLEQIAVFASLLGTPMAPMNRFQLQSHYATKEVPA
jgi:hypothetical protein